MASSLASSQVASGAPETWPMLVCAIQPLETSLQVTRPAEKWFFTRDEPPGRGANFAPAKESGAFSLEPLSWPHKLRRRRLAHQTRVPRARASLAAQVSSQAASEPAVSGRPSCATRASGAANGPHCRSHGGRPQAAAGLNLAPLSRAIIVIAIGLGEAPARGLSRAEPRGAGPIWPSQGVACRASRGQLVGCNIGPSPGGTRLARGPRFVGRNSHAIIELK